jgi:hypothetical protein
MRRSSSVIGFWIAVTLASVARTSGAAVPDRSGFTLELGIGPAVNVLFEDLHSVTTFNPAAPGTSGVVSEYTRTRAYVGVAPLSLSLGGFLSRNVALMFRLAGTSHFKNRDQIVNGFYGPAIQYWLSDGVFIGGGVGLGILAPNPLISSSSEGKAGLAFNARLGVSPWSLEHHWFGAVLELFPAVYERTRVLGMALNLQWQLL